MTGFAEIIIVLFFGFVNSRPELCAVLEILLAEEPDNRKYQDWQNWLKKNYEELQQLILSEESEITMGMQIMSCEKGSL